MTGRTARGGLPSLAVYKRKKTNKKTNLIPVRYEDKY